MSFHRHTQGQEKILKLRTPSREPKSKIIIVLRTHEKLKKNKVTTFFPCWYIVEKYANIRAVIYFLTINANMVR